MAVAKASLTVLRTKDSIGSAYVACTGRPPEMNICVFSIIITSAQKKPQARVTP